MTDLRPVVGGDRDAWGSELLAWIGVSLASDGTLVASQVRSALGGFLMVTFSHEGVMTAPVTGIGLSPMPCAGTVKGVIAAAATGPVGSAAIFDVNLNGTTIFTTQANRPTIASGATKSSLVVPDVTALVIGDVITMDFDQAGSTTPASDPTVVVLIG